MSGNISRAALFHKYMEQYSSLIRYGIVGGINTAVDFGVFTLLTGLLRVSPGSSQALAYSAGVCNSFLMNKFWTFGSRKNDKKKTSWQLLQFVVVNLFTMGISIYALHILTEYMGINTYISKICITLLTLILNYLGYKLWVFKR